MQTAICTFADHAAAERARDRLLDSGFPQADLHLEHPGRHMEATRQEDLRHRGGAEHEIALSTDVVERVAGFFGRLFGADHPHAEVYSSHVEDGRTVLLLDAHAPGDVERARTVLEGEQAGHYDVVDRTGGRRMRDVLSSSEVGEAAAARARNVDWARSTADRPTTSRDVHAAAANDTGRDPDNRDGMGRARTDD